VDRRPLDALRADCTSRGRRQEALYPDATRDRARQRLSTDVANLRGRIRHALGADPPSGDPVINTGGRYHLNPDLIDIDWWHVQDAAARARTSTDTAEQLSALHQALTHFHGPLAGSHDYDWATRAQDHTRKIAINVHTRIAALIAGTDPHRAAHLLETACDLDPYNEDTAQLALHAHARLGDTDAIRTRLRRLRAALDELEETPDEATETLVKHLLTRTTTPTRQALNSPGRNASPGPQGNRTS
jgi:DNA-binding SARP family transcriptional activator